MLLALFLAPFLATAIAWAVKLLFLGLGAGCLLLADRVGRRHQRLMAQGRAATAVVLRMEIDPDPNSNTYFPVVSFVTDTGATITARHHYGGQRSAYREGQPVPLHYDPAQPTSFAFDADPNAAFTGGFRTAGYVMLAVGLLLCWWL